MLMDSSFSSSTETSLLNVSEYQEPFGAYNWVSHAETYKAIQTLSTHSKVSFLEPSPPTDVIDVDESSHPKLQINFTEESGMHKASEKSLTSHVYSRRKQNVKPGGSTEHKPGKTTTTPGGSLDDPQVSVQSPGDSKKRKNRFDNCLVYSRKNRRVISSFSLSGERDDQIADVIVSEHNSGETKRRGNRFDKSLVYSRKKGGTAKSNCSFTKHDSGGTKRSCDQADSSAIVKADGSCTGEIKNSCNQLCFSFVYRRKKHLVKSNSYITKSCIEQTKRQGDRSDVLLLYSRRPKTIVTSTGPNPETTDRDGARVNGFLVYSRRKLRLQSSGTLTEHHPRETNKNGDQLAVVGSQELIVNSQVAEMTCSSDESRETDGLSDSSSSLKSSSVSSKSREEDEATGCVSSDSELSATDSENSSSSSSPFRQCKLCGKPGKVEKMIICDKCEEAYHTRCSNVQEVTNIDEWYCSSCLKKKLKLQKSSKAKSRGRISRQRKWRSTEPFVIGIRIGKEYQADVPDWSGPIMSDSSFVGEPLEIDESEYTYELEKVNNGKKPLCAVNWLQCKDEDSNGNICGKWRRAPRTEVQTEDWECFCCVFWDPSHADCAVPQELETSEILKQLKYIKMLRPRLDRRRRKLGPKGRSRSRNRPDVKGES